MRHNSPFRFLLPLLCCFSLLAQGTASIQFTQTFTSATTGSAVNNGPTIAGGPQGSVAFRLVYYIEPGTGTVSALSVELDGAATSGGSYTALTPAVGGGSGSGSTLNPVTTFPRGQNVLCCDFWPWLKIKVNTFTVSTGTPILLVKVLGYAGTSAAADQGGGGGGSGITALTQDVLASGSGSVAATVVGIDTVPLCSGFAPTNGQFLKYSTALSPNPCYTAAVPAGGGTIATTTNTLKGDGAGNAIAVTGTATNCVLANGTTTPCAGGGTIATTTNALVGDGAGNAIAASGTGTNCLQVNGGNTSCSGGGGGGGGTGLTVYSGLAGVTLTNATIYFPVGGGSLANGTETSVQTFQGSAGTVSGFGANLSVALGTTIAVNNSVVLTWRKNATGQTVTCTITNPATTCSDTTHSFTFAAGDSLDIQAVFTGTISATPTWVMNAGVSSGTPASSGSFVLLAELTASNSATLDLTTRNATGQSGALFQSDYDTYQIEAVDVVPVTSTVGCSMVLSTNGGSTWDTGANYNWASSNFIRGSGASNGSGTATNLPLDDGSSQINNAGAPVPGLTSSVRVSNPSGAHLQIAGRGSYPPNYYASGYVIGFVSAGFYFGATGVNAIRVFMSSGNISTGTIRVYGLAK